MRPAASTTATVMTMAVLISWATPARADGRGEALYQGKCMRCHVVGAAAAQLTAERAKLYVDLTTATQAHDEKWLRAFLQRPSLVVRDTACRAKLDDAGAVAMYRFLRSQVRPARDGESARSGGRGKKGAPAAESSAALPASGTVAGGGGQIPPQSTGRIAEPLPKVKPTGMVHR
jgi:cytochrome c2